MFVGKLSESEEEMEIVEEEVTTDIYDQSQVTYYDGQTVEQYQVSLANHRSPTMMARLLNNIR